MGSELGLGLGLGLGLYAYWKSEAGWLASWNVSWYARYS